MNWWVRMEKLIRKTMKKYPKETHKTWGAELYSFWLIATNWIKAAMWDAIGWRFVRNFSILMS